MEAEFEKTVLEWRRNKSLLMFAWLVTVLHTKPKDILPATEVKTG